MKKLLILVLFFNITAKTIKVGIASKNVHKINAVKEVFVKKFVDDDLEFLSFESDSKIPEQPVSFDVALVGAKNRITSINSSLLQNLDYVVAIENYIESVNQSWWDRGLVLIQKNNEQNFALTNPVLVPEKFIEIAKTKSSFLSDEGFSYAVGQAIKDFYSPKNIDPSDWHKEKEFGGVSRKNLLKAPIFKLINFDQIDFLKSFAKNYQDFPKVGVSFVDFLPIFNNPESFEIVIDLLVQYCKDKNFDLVVGLESRGFIVGSALAYKLGVGFVPLRKPGKLPGEHYKIEYKKEYGSDILCLSKTAIKPGQKVLVVDDLIATGGSAKAAIELVKLAGVDCVEFLSILNVKKFEYKVNLGVNYFNLID